MPRLENALAGQIGACRRYGFDDSELVGELFLVTLEKKLAQLLTEAPKLNDEQRQKAGVTFRTALDLAGFSS